MNQHAMYIGLLASTTFVLLDNFYPHTVILHEQNKKRLKEKYILGIYCHFKSLHIPFHILSCC